MKKRRFAAIALAGVMAFGLTACGSSNSQSAGSASSAAASSASETSTSGEKNTDAEYTVGVCQSLEHESLDAATKGFREELEKKLGDKVTIDVQNAQGESTNNSTICNKFVSNGYDLIMANATPALQAASQATDSIPVVGTSVTSYSDALGLKDFNGTTGTNVTGTSDLAPIDQQEDIFTDMMPNVKKIGILYCSAEPNSIVQAESFEKYAKEDGLSTKVYTAADSNEIQSVTTKACQECDALYIPTDNTFAAAIETVKNIVQPEKIPLVTGWGDTDAGVAAVSIDYYDLGAQTADMAYEILVNKKDPGEMEVQTADKTTKTYNKKLCKELNLTIPDGYTAA